MKLSIKTLIRILSSLLATQLSASGTTAPFDQPQDSAIRASIENIPSALWPQFISSTQPIIRGEKTIRTGSKGTLQRCEDDLLVVDFGRNGTVKVEVQMTNFAEQISNAITRKNSKDFPNLTIQIGNKLMTFGEGRKSGPLQMDEVTNTEIFVLLYLDTYYPEQAVDLHSFGLAYADLKTKHPEITGVILAKDKSYYDFGFTVSYQVPYIAPHQRTGYIQSFAHEIPSYPHLILADPNGRILHRSPESIAFKDLTNELEEALQGLGLNWEKPTSESQTKSRSRSAKWLAQ